VTTPHSIPSPGTAPIDPDQARRFNAPPQDDQVSLADRQLKQLSRLIEIGCRMAERFDPWSQQEDMKASAQAKMQSSARLTDAIRKLMALEQYTAGIRDKRFKFVRGRWLEGRRTVVRQSVEQALVVSKPEMEPRKRENLLGDLFRGYADLDSLEHGNLRDIVAGICETQGVTADLSIWDEPACEPNPSDFILPAGHDWVVPQNGDRPYTVQTRADGKRIRVHWDGPEMRRHGSDPPLTV